MSSDEEPFEYDVFISHASEDKAGFVGELADALRASGLRVWYDEWALVLGDRLRRRIDEGLKRSRFGVLVLSKSFFAKDWPAQELDGLVALEGDGSTRILPIWHGVGRTDVAQFSPTLADRLATDSSRGVDAVVGEIVRAVGQTPTSSPVSAPVRRARRRNAVNEHLRPRNLAGDEGPNFGLNTDARLLQRRERDCTVECGAFAVLSLVPVGREEELDSKELVEWASRRGWPESHPLAGQDTRPRADGVMVRQAGREEGTLLRYTYISGDAYVEWGRSLGGCYEDVCLMRLGPLLWAASHLYEFLGELRTKFDLRGDYELVVSISGAKGTCLSHLGEKWLEPWAKGYPAYRPLCADDSVQYRRPMPFSQGEADRREMLLDLDVYLNRAWGDGEPRGHDHRDTTSSGVPTLSDKYRHRDPWE